MIPPPLSQYLMIAKLIALLGGIGIICFQSSQIHKWHTHYDSEHKARVEDRNSYVAAQGAAKIANQNQISQIKAEQQGITSNVEKSYEDDLARLRTELAERLRPQAPTAPGASGSPKASDLPNAARVPDDPSRVSIPSSLYVRGAELELQLEHLQDWVRQQAAVDPNKP